MSQERSASEDQQPRVGWPRLSRLGRSLRLSSEGPGLRNFILLATALAAFLGLAVRTARLYYWNVVDDATISMVFGKHLALGQGVVFNLGERVEGYTNFTWVVLCAACYWVARLLSADYVAVVVGANIALGALATLLSYALALRLWRDRWLATALALGYALVDNSWTAWAALGLEGHLLAVTLLATLLALSSALRFKGAWVGLGLAAAMMTRPDAALFVALVLAHEAITTLIQWARARRAPGARLRELGQTLGVLALVYGAYWWWRYDYFGYPFPNTYYLKLGAGKIDAWQRGREYVQGFFKIREYVPAAALLGVLALGQPVARLLLLYVGLHVFYVVYVGGDFFPGHRFLVAQVPLFGLLMGAGVAQLARWLERPSPRRWLERLGLPSAALGGGVVVVVAGALLAVAKRGLAEGPIHAEVMVWRDEVANARRYMEWLREVKPAGEPRFATGLIGNAGLFAEMRVIDLYGVIDPIAAHRETRNFGKGKAGHEKMATYGEMMARRPDYIMVGYVADDFWRSGFFLDVSMPRSIKTAGIWHRDPLPAAYERLPGGMSFSPEEFAAWQLEGEAFAAGAASAPPRGHERVIGAVGSFVTSFVAHRGDDATGKALSPPFTLEGDVLTLRVGGGGGEPGLAARLLVDGEVKYGASGRQSGMLGRVQWDIAPWRGKPARLELVDEVRGGWGHLVVDELEQWRRR